MKPSRPSAKFHVSIDRLVLHGFAPGQRQAIAQSLRDELARQLAEPGSAQTLAQAFQSGNKALLRGGQLRLSSDSSAHALGTQAAQRIVQRLRG